MGTGRSSSGGRSPFRTLARRQRGAMGHLEFIRVEFNRGATSALSDISLRGTRVSAMVVGFAANAAGTAPVQGPTGRGST
jgi:hypothetical protein